MSLADKLIEQAERRPDGVAPAGYYKDDMGYFVELGITEDKARYSDYLLRRILRRHNNIYTRHGTLRCGHRLIEGTVPDMLSLIDSPLAKINSAQAAWLYNRLLEMAPEMDERYILLSRDLVWDEDAGDLRDTDEFDNIITAKE